MNQHGTTLHDMMTVILPEDLLDPRHLANTEIITLKTLRLVNREFSTTALRSVKSCEVHVGGDRTSPNPEQLCRLMAEATLVKLKLTVTVTSGGITLNTSSGRLICKRLLTFVCCRSIPTYDLIDLYVCAYQKVILQSLSLV